MTRAEIVTTATSVGTISANFWPSAGRTVVLVHGLTAERESWGELAERLAEDHQVLAVDLRGHGSSSWATWEDDGYTSARMAADVAALCAELRIADAAVVGHSLGARVAMALAADTKLVAGIALSDTFPVVGEHGARWANEQIGERLTSAALRSKQDALTWLRERHPEWNPGWAELLATTHFRENWAGRWVFKCDPQLIWLLRGAASRAEGARVRALAESVRQPALLMWGRDSALVGSEEVIASVALFQAPIVREFPTGHYIMRQREHEWVEAVRDFCTDLP